MDKKSVISLPWGECVIRSMSYVLLHTKTVFFIIALGLSLLIPEALLSTPLFCSISSATDCGAQAWGYYLITALIFIFSSYVIVTFSRFIILKEEPKKFNFFFGRRELKVFFYSMVLEAIPGFVLGGLFMFLSEIAARQSAQPFSVLILLAMILIFVGIIVLSRFSLVFCAASVDNEELTLKRSFVLTQGNTNKIFWGSFVVSLPLTILMMFSGVFVATASGSLAGKLLLAGWVLLVSLGNVCFKTSFIAHVYQYFIYFESKRLEDSEAAAVEK